MRLRIGCLWVGLFAAVGVGPAARAAEPWADPKLPTAAGLELWLDASRLAADGRPAPAAGQPVAVWPDASGRGRHLRQSTAAARPTLVAGGPGPLVRFDGDDDHLRFAGPAADADAVTVFVVAVPRANLGGFRGLVAFNAPGRRDYETGLNIDQGPDGSAEFDYLNVEGRGLTGARNLLRGPRPYGPLYTIEVQADAGTVRAAVDGTAAGERPRRPGAVSLAEITVGARFPDAGPGPQKVRSFLNGDIAEVLVYSRVLPPAEVAAVRTYLAAKHAKLREALAVVRGTPLVRAADPPPVQVFLPGFAVREVPVDLPNVNNVRYRPDGTLVALCYNGDVYLLRDTDGDGLPDKAELFWDNKGRLVAPVGMALTPPGYKHGDGLFVAAKGKVVLLADTDGDGKADKETVIAEGWPATTVSVDAVGVAFDPRDGSVYFGLGCADYSNAYQTDKEGRSKFKLDSERGTILKVAPDLKSREVVCTGIRWPVGLGFNRHGDLFVADQEGATWLPNGNPFDELLHIQKGRHYGFPPRHPKHLPGVIDEPSVYDYGPQHQSTCGFAFNEPVNGGPVFGSAAWAGDALVTGESRGKLYRTQLVKTPAGYVARNHVLACLNMLLVDACVTPDGGLVVACHSGKPDWGTGPTGKGKLYQISTADRGHPQPVAVWPAGPREVRVAFDRPVDPAQFAGVVAKTALVAGRYVRAGDRFESLRPGYKVVQTQLAVPRYAVRVPSAQLSPDRRTLILATGPQAGAVHYALTLPGMGRPPAAGKGELRQVPEIDLDYDLTGVEARWQPAAGDAWGGWLPHPDLAVARPLTAGSATHDALWAAMTTPGELTLRTQFDLADMLRPAVQPGSRLDHEWPAEDVTLAFQASGPLTLRSPAGRVETAGGVTRLTVRPTPGKTVPVEIVLRSAGGPPALAVSYHTAEDARPRALPLRRVLVPWAATTPDAFDAAPPPPPPEIAGGSWARGHKLFFGDEIGCTKCHTLHGRGGAAGPDLSNLVHRDYASVLRDIAEPSAAINPDYVTYRVDLTDGRTLAGTVRTEGDRLLVGDQQGVTTTVRRADVEAMTPAAVSTMPEGLAKRLGPERLRDLMTFLLTEPRMPDYGRTPPPPPRPRAEVRAALAGAPPAAGPPRPLNVVLVAGPKDHGPGEHDYPAWLKVWSELLAAADATTVTTARDWPSADQLATADVLVFYQRGDWTPARAAATDAFLERGGGLVYLHWAVEGGADPPGFAKRIGLASRAGDTLFRHGPLDLDLAGKHPITRNLAKLRLVDESYWKLAGDPAGVRVLGTGVEQGKAWPLVWTTEPGRGRAFVSIPGHYAWTFDDPLFRLVLLRGIAWAAKEPVDRFNELVWPGARTAD